MSTEASENERTYQIALRVRCNERTEQIALEQVTCNESPGQMWKAAKNQVTLVAGECT